MATDGPSIKRIMPLRGEPPHILGVRRRMTATQLIADGYALFSAFPRPDHFHDRLDGESEDHEATLQARDLGTLELNDVACIGYNPITAIEPEGMAYFFPKLVELALDMESRSGYENEPYLCDFLSQIRTGPSERRFSLFSSKHIQFVCRFVRFVGEKYMAHIEKRFYAEEFNAALEGWCVECDT